MATTTTERKITFAQFQHYERLMKEQEEDRGHHALVDSNVYENFVQGVIMHEREMKPSYASVLNQGRKRAPPECKYAAAVAALGGIPANTKAPPKKKCAPPQEKNDDGPQQVVLGQCGYVPHHVCQMVLEACQGRRFATC